MEPASPGPAGPAPIWDGTWEAAGWALALGNAGRSPRASPTPPAEEAAPAGRVGLMDCADVLLPYLDMRQR